MSVLSKLTLQVVRRTPVIESWSPYEASRHVTPTTVSAHWAARRPSPWSPSPASEWRCR
jgi:hypothetical protein